MKDTEASVHVTAFLLEGDKPRKTVSQLKHECKSFVHALVFCLVTEGWKPEFRENYRQHTYMKAAIRKAD